MAKIVPGNIHYLKENHFEISENLLQNPNSRKRCKYSFIFNDYGKAVAVLVLKIKSKKMQNLPSKSLQNKGEVI